MSPRWISTICLQVARPIPKPASFFFGNLEEGFKNLLVEFPWDADAVVPDFDSRGEVFFQGFRYFCPRCPHG